MFIYLIVEQRGDDAAAHGESPSPAAMDEYIRTTATGGGGGAASEIDKAKGLLDSGAITQAEFDAIKQKALA